MSLMPFQDTTCLWWSSLNSGLHYYPHPRLSLWLSSTDPALLLFFLPVSTASWLLFVAFSVFPSSSTPVHSFSIPSLCHIRSLKGRGLTGPRTTVLAKGLGQGQSIHWLVFRQLPLEPVLMPGMAGHVSMAHTRATYVRGTPQSELWAYKYLEAVNKWAGEWAGCLIESVHYRLGGRKMGYSGCGLFYNKGQRHTCIYFTDNLSLYLGY